ncbi:MAG: hypothetical protein ACI92I_000863 [Acidimicrobiales bacterium]|jgi:hypothetical protein
MSAVCDRQVSNSLQELNHLGKASPFSGATPRHFQFLRCEPSLATSRTLPKEQIQAFENLNQILRPMNEPAELPTLMEMFDRLIGNKPKPKPVKKDPDVPQWRYNIKGQHPVAHKCTETP